jgi:hypothetical protein
MINFTNATLSRCFFWFALVVGLFAVFTQMSGRITFASSYFYIQLGILAMLASLTLKHEQR